MSLSSAYIAYRMERMSPFSSKRAAKALLTATCGDIFKKMYAAPNKKLNIIAGCASEAYWRGVIDGKAGNSKQSENDIDAAVKGKSADARLLCEFVYQAYCAGFDVGCSIKEIGKGELG